VSEWDDFSICPWVKKVDPWDEPTVKPKPSEDAIQETIPFEDEETIKGVAYPLLMLSSGLFVFKKDIPPADSEPASDGIPEHNFILYVPTKSKSGKTKKVKMHPMTGVKIRSKIADKDKHA
jgi:hypothetical protein